MSDLGLVIYGIVTIFSGMFSSIAGGGGGFISTPLMIFLGLSPQEAIASGKLGGLAIVVSNIRVFRKEKLHSWKLIMPLIFVSIVIGLIAPKLIVRIDGEAYKTVLGVLLLAMIPIIHFKKVGHVKEEPSKNKKVAGYLLIVIAMLMQGVFSGGLGSLVNLVLVSFLGMGALEANITKRFTQIFLNGAIVLGLLGTGLIIWRVVAVGITANLVGGTIGANIAVKKGNAFVMNVLKVAMLMSGVALLLI